MCINNYLCRSLDNSCRDLWAGNQSDKRKRAEQFLHVAIVATTFIAGVLSLLPLSHFMEQRIKEDEFKICILT